VEISISSRHVRVTPRLEEVIREKIGDLDRYFEKLDSGVVHFTETRNPRISDKISCEVVLDGDGHRIRCKVSASDPYAAVDLAEEKLTRQIRKLRTRLRRIHQGSDTIRVAEGHAPNVVDLAGVDFEESDEEPMPRIVKTKRFHIGPLTPDDAVLKMELLGHGFFFFVNKETSRAAVVYRRDDGDVGLIDVAD